VTDRAKTATFITVLAWILISFTGLGAASALLQNVLVNILSSAPHMDPWGQSTRGQEPFLILRIVVAFLFLFLLFALVCAVGLLKRKDWARRTFIALFALGIGFHAVALLLFVLGAGVFSPPAPALGAQAQFASMVRLMVIPMTVGALGISILFGWLIKRLVSTDVDMNSGQVAEKKGSFPAGRGSA
jgi:hypothetical protein